MDRKITVILADKNKLFRQIFTELLENEGDFEVVASVGDGRELLEACRQYNPDIIIMEMILSTFNGVEVMERLWKIRRKVNSKIILLYAMADYEELAAISKYGVSCYLEKPCEPQEVITRARNLAERKGILGENACLVLTGQRETQYLESVVTKIIREIGIPANVKGYHYLREAIVLTVNDMEMIDSITKVLYPAVAEKFDTTPSQVERSIRSAINLAWEKGDEWTLIKFFDSKPTNAEFIATIADQLYLQKKTTGEYSGF
jgi:two-component system response regulator (stage 0 sporulation protein A)